MNKLLLSVLAAAIVAAGGAFYGGMKYGESKSAFPAGRNFGNFQAGDMQARFQQRSAGTANSGTARPAGGGMVTGEIISKDDKSLTIKESSGSKIVFFGSSVAVNKTVSGSVGDLKVGDSVSVIGSANSDGSITAESIQLRPQLQN